MAPNWRRRHLRPGRRRGSHIGDALTTILIPTVVELVKGHKSPVTGAQAPVVVAGQDVRTASFDDYVLTIISTGRPLRVRKNFYIQNLEENGQNEIKELTSKGVIPVEHDLKKKDGDDETMDSARPFLMAKEEAVTNEKKLAKVMVDEMISGAVK
ncbi:hypothetical protein GQ43DRAFT_430365 [Delitschia confertaspora ATCC 74209]|uniref:Uncharacterized protein n=1 Tax=Delitschia confertaspora ATCC 74209 TaxID=1513339 RepID=A0A9P4JNU8_9PLEO|nr:hypothetical protein GQ43DRAFT_430365 [Delitschia confertaspora ATCC 74209]